jgi:diguanylate cyclase (GGDEF)-like protein/PAS domain S-box-containing protein
MHGLERAALDKQSRGPGDLMDPNPGFAFAGVFLLLIGAALAWLGARRLKTAERLLHEAGERAAVAKTADDENAQSTFRFLEQVLDRVQDGVVVCDAGGRVVRVNEAATRLFERSADTLLGRDLREMIEPDVFGADDSVAPSGSAYIRCAGGEVTPVAYTGCSLAESGTPAQWAVVFRNLTDEQRTQKRIRYLARYDTLTRVPNRMEFQHRLQQAIARARRSGTRLALLYIDMDGFKDVNDRLGHPIGDRALEIMSRRLVDGMESGTLAGRLGGDEFALVIEGLPAEGDSRPAVAASVRPLLDTLAQKFHVEGHELVLTASIGIAMFPDDADNVIDIIRNADAAMYHAKQNGGNTYGFYTREMNTDAVDRLVLKSELRSAIQRNEFEVLYQPKVDLRDGRIAGCEALLRWRHSRRGDVPPSIFIPLAEENTLIFEIGEWVLEHVCEDFLRWQRKIPWPGRVAVNLSLRQLRQRDFVSSIERIFKRHQLTPSCVELEITESTLADHGENTLRMLDGLYQMGLHLSIDDFGTGYSSLTSLQHFPIGTLKIDHSFVRDASEKHNSEAIVGAIVGLGRNLGMDVVAEGIETPEQLSLLRRIGCTYGQGHLFGEPVTGERYLELLVGQQQGQPALGELFAEQRR